MTPPLRLVVDIQVLLSGVTGSKGPSFELWQAARRFDVVLVLWDRDRLSVLPFIPEQMNTAVQIKAFMPELQGAFVAGSWLVQQGKALSGTVVLMAATSDVRTLRPRVFLGVTPSGVPLLGVSSAPVNPERLAQAAVAAGAQEAVLLF